MIPKDAVKKGIEQIRPFVMEGRDVSDIAMKIDDFIENLCNDGTTNLNLSDRLRLREELFSSLRSLSTVDTILSDEQVKEILITAPDCVFIDRGNGLEKSNHVFADADALCDTIKSFAEQHSSTKEPIGNVISIKDNGIYMEAMLPPVAAEPFALIRLKGKETSTLAGLAAKGIISDTAATVLAEYVREGKNILIAGKHDTGKTELLNALCEEIGKDERIAIVEDFDQIKVDDHHNVVRMLASKYIASKLVEAAIRMVPDRLVIDSNSELNKPIITAFKAGQSMMATIVAADGQRAITTLLDDYLKHGNPPIATKKRIANAIDVLISVTGDRRSRSVKVYTVNFDGIDIATSLVNK